MSYFKNPVYRFWNGKNLNGKQEFFDVSPMDSCRDCHFRCVVGSETVSGDELYYD